MMVHSPNFPRSVPPPLLLVLLILFSCVHSSARGDDVLDAPPSSVHAAVVVQASTAEFITNLVTFGFPAFLLCVLLAVAFSLRTVSTHPIRAVLVPVACAATVAALLNILPLAVESSLNGVLPIAKHHIPDDNQHVTFKVADLHADTLLWNGRDFTRVTADPLRYDSPVGHVDLPRLREGSVALQVFAIVNAVPRQFNLHRNARPRGLRDALILKTVLERWPATAWLSPRGRVMYSASRLHDAAAVRANHLSVVSTAHQLPVDSAIDHENRTVHALLAVEGLSCLENSISNVDAFFDVGIRILGPTHLFDTEVGGSLSGECQCGLTDFGRRVMQRMRELGMIVDLAHAHPTLVSDILSLPSSDRPAVMISHTGVKAVCNSSRNVGDDVLSDIAAAGGLIGITLFEPAICGEDLVQSWVNSVRHVIQLTGGVHALALGSDWDGAVSVAVTPDRVNILSASLMAGDDALSEQHVQRIMFTNANDFFRRSLPRNDDN